MAVDINKLMEQDEVGSALFTLLQAAYRQGTTDALLRVVSLAEDEGVRAPPKAISSEHVVPQFVIDLAAGAGKTHSFRVARGLVQATVEAVIAQHPGLSISEIEKLVLEKEPAISQKSVGNELRRGETAGKYKRDRPGGYSWYLNGETEAEPEEFEDLIGSASTFHSSKEGGDGHGPATT